MLVLSRAKVEPLIAPEHVRAELGEVVSGSAPGRTSPEERTLYKSVGIAVEGAGGIGTDVEV